MDTQPNVLDWRHEAPIVGYHRFHPDDSINFQCNRWAQWIGPDALAEIHVLAQHANTYPEWIDGFLALADQARRAGRIQPAAYYSRAAEFFMTPTDPRRPITRAQFLTDMRTLYNVTPTDVPYRDANHAGALPAYDLKPPGPPVDTLLIFGGFDSYIEEFLPMIVSLVATGYRVITFDGPGQGGALEDHGLPMRPQWEKPVAAVLDHFGVNHDVTAIGVSLGGGLVIRAAAFEPRLRRVIAFDILDDELDVTARQIGRGASTALRLLLSLRARPVINAIARRAATRKPVSAWGLQQGLHITGSPSAYHFLATTRATHTRTISDRITGDVLLLAGADDHYVPLRQLHRQAENLVNARSVTTRIFTTAEQAGNHCQIGNVGLALRVCLSWLEGLTTSSQDPEPAASAGWSCHSSDI